MTPLEFLHPERIHLVWAAAALALILALLERRGRDLVGRFIGPAMAPRLVRRPPPGRHAARLACLFAAAALAVVALARPQSRGATEAIQSREGSAEVMVLLDVSRSMLAEDAAPNRLERAKAELRDLARELSGHNLGLMAFAGRASVLCPLTPDRGFFLLCLDAVSPRTVARGGTRIGDAIRKALDGFSPGEGAKAIVLVTDGEDHDSYPLEAAKLARSAGVRIIAIGFGDEKGAEIQVTDPRTGERSALRDRSGAVVRSRLEGAALRDIALTTEGAYIPAGVGVLDLRSIVQAHIDPLIRMAGSAGGAAARVVRAERYQGFVLGAMALLLAAAVLGVGAGTSTSTSTSTSGKAAAVALALLLAGASPARAAGPGGAAGPASGSGAAPAAVSSSAAPKAESAKAEPPPPPPRRAYNGALRSLEAKDVEAALKGFTDARDRAGADAELRFRAAFNLGLAYAARADALEGASGREGGAREAGASSLGEGKLEDAIAALRTGAAWFRDAVRERPQDREARASLEVLLRRIQALADQVNRRAGTLEAKLEKVIEDERALRDEVRGLTTRIAEAGAGTEPASFQDAFRAAGAFQRVLLSETSGLAALAGEEAGHLESKKEEERTQEERGRLVALQNLGIYIDRARQRMADTRALLRTLQGDAAHRKSDAAVRELLRAREQLLDPAAVLKGIVEDEAALFEHTQALAAAASTPIRAAPAGEGAPPAAAPPAPPPWLTPSWLAEGQEDAEKRAGELGARLEAGLEHAAKAGEAPGAPGATAPGAGPGTGAATGTGPGTGASAGPRAGPGARTPDEERKLARVIEAAKEALPLVQAAEKAMGSAAAALAVTRTAEAAGFEREALERLIRAAERFSGIRALIELSYGDQAGIVSLLTPPAPGAETGKAPPLPAAERGRRIADALARNRERLARLEGLFKDEVAAIEEKEAAAKSAPGSAEPVAPPGAVKEQGKEASREGERYRLAEEARKAAADALAKLDRALGPAEGGARLAGADAADQPGAAGPAAEAEAEADAPAPATAGGEPGATAGAAGGAALAPPAPGADRGAPPGFLPLAREGLERIETLRRLFFSIVEHLEDLLRRQSETRDKTASAATETDPAARAQALGPLAAAEARHAEIGKRLGDALAEEASRASTPGAGWAQRAGPGGADPAATLSEAGKEVATAAASMDAAAGELRAGDAQIEPVLGKQKEAIEHLTTAILLLKPPQQGEQKQDGEKGKEDKKEKEDQERALSRDQAQRRLQAIRDREADRRRKDRRDQQTSPEPVEKDW